MKQKMQMVGQAMLVPISIITIGSVFMGFGGAFTSAATVEALGLTWLIHEGSLTYNIFTIMKAMGDVVFRNLPIFFAIGISFGLARREKGWAAFSGAVGFLAMHFIISTLFTINGISAETTTADYFQNEMGMTAIKAVQHSSLYTNELGMFSYRMSIFGGLIIGLITSYLHNKLYNVKLPMVLSFFAGTRTVPIVTLVVGSFIGILLFYAWPPIGLFLAALSNFFIGSGLVGTGIWAMVDKGLVPLGLHHLITTPIRLTELGGTVKVCGELVSGTTNIYMAQMACDTTEKFLVRGFQSGRVVLHFGGLAGAALAMWQCAAPAKRKAVAGLLIPSVLTMILFGVTEPIEYTFLFVAPWLFFFVHVPLTGLIFVLTEWAQVSIYGGSVKDILPVLLQPDKLNLWGYLWLIPLFFAVYYFLFRYLILKFDVKTPGREDQDGDVKLYTKSDYKEKNGELPATSKKSQGLEFAQDIIDAFGGEDNIIQLDNCISRLRVEVKDGSKVVADDVWKNDLRAHGVVRIEDNGFQIIYGSEVVMIAGDCKELLSIDE